MTATPDLDISATRVGGTAAHGTGPAAHSQVTEPRRQPIVRLARPHASRTRSTDLLAVAGFVVAVTLGLWWQHGGLDLLLTGGTSMLLAIGQLTGLMAALAALGAIVLTARPVFLERRYGLDLLLAWHRWLGITTVFAVVAHSIIDTWAWAASSGMNFFGAAGDLLANEAWMVAALASFVIFVTIGMTSWRRLKKRMSYETWYFIHTLGYLAVLLGFGHQLTLGADFTADSLAFWWWTLLAVAALVLVLYARVGTILGSLRRRLYVTAISREANGIGSIHVNGPSLRRMRVEGGQFFIMRPLAKGLWWQAHPFSVSAAPTTGGLRFTVKELGDDTPNLLRMKPGTRVLLEGPYGRFTADRAKGKRVVLFAGGVGIAPIRAILEDCHPHQEPVVIVRVRHESDLPHRAELERLVESRNGRLHVLTGTRHAYAQHDPFGAATLQAWIPDLRHRHAFLCGPASLESAVIRGLRKAGMPTSNIHLESFGV